MNVSLNSAAAPHARGRQQIYYWKCDRPAAFHGTQVERETRLIEPLLQTQLELAYPGKQVVLRDGGGQGNHLTWIVDIGDDSFFARIENGPERENHLTIESEVMRRVRSCGVPTPRVHHVDTQRTAVPFAWQLMDLVPARDLNHCHKSGLLNPVDVAFDIGVAIAKWQSVPVSGFGHFRQCMLEQCNQLQGYHFQYMDYYLMNWEKHLAYLENRQFLTTAETDTMRMAVESSEELLTLTAGCLVHKDLAFWNILGDQHGIAAYVDWDDAVAADEMDDLSLLACFHDREMVAQAVAGYQSIKTLPDEHAGRFWLHLLRNLVVKSVIRVGAGYFDRTDGFFLIGKGMTGADLVQDTRSRLFRALEGLRSREHVTDL